MQAKKRLGEMLVESNLLTREDLQQVLIEHRKAGLKLGQFLVRRGAIAENQIVDVLSQQLKIDKYYPDKYPVDVDLARLIPIATAQKYLLAPLRKKGRLLTIALTDPLDINILDTIEVMTDSEVEPVVCTEREVNMLINSIYGAQSKIGDVLESMKIDSRVDDELDAEPAADDIKVASLQEMAGEAPVVRLVNSIFAQGVREGASDIHLSPQKENIQIRFRIDGKLHEVPSPPKSLFLPMAARIKILANMDITVSRLPQDGRFTLRVDKKEINVRISSMPTIYGENIVLRLLDMSAGIYTLDDPQHRSHRQR
jgi:type IV pilus assembly protein PilB